MTPPLRLPRRRIATLVLLSAALGCARGGTDAARLVPSTLEGAWMFTSTVSSDSCPQGTNVLLPAGGFFIDATGPALVLSQTGCCTSTVWGTGAEDGLSLTFSGGREVQRDATCTLQVEESLTGDVAADRIAGEGTITVSAPETCGAGYPCQIRGAVSASRCSADLCGVLCPNIFPCFG